MDYGLRTTDYGLRTMDYVALSDRYRPGYDEQRIGLRRCSAQDESGPARCSNVRDSPACGPGGTGKPPAVAFFSLLAGRSRSPSRWGRLALGREPKLCRGGVCP